MMDSQQRDHLEQLRQINMRRLQFLEKQAAKYGIDTKPEIYIEMQDIIDRIDKINNDLGKYTLDLVDENITGSLSLNAPINKFIDVGKSSLIALEFEEPRGTMSPASKFYIERQCDNDCWNHLRRSRAVTVYIQAPRQMGKSSLLCRINNRIERELGLPTVLINFELFTEQQLDNEEDFLIEFCSMIGDDLGIPDKTQSYWSNKKRSNIIKCSRYLSQYIIQEVKTPFILAMDEVERILNKPIRNDFFGMLRSWHNDRAKNDNFTNMSMFISSSTEPSLFIDNMNQSPFNVAEPIYLQDFRLDEVIELNIRHNSPIDENNTKDLFSLLDGHPFLTRLALYLLSTKKISFNTLFSTSNLDGSPFEEHLQRYWEYILENPELKSSLYYICRYQIHPEDKIFYRLKGAGLIKKLNQKVVMRNELYANYFMRRFNV